MTPRVLRIITRLNIGGPAVHAVLLSRGPEARGLTTCLVAGASEPGEGDLGDRLAGADVRLRRLRMLRRPIHPLADAVALGQLLRILWRERPDIIHTHMAKAGTLGRLAGLAYNALGPGRHSGRRAVLIHTFHGHVLEGYFSVWASRVFVRIERWLARRTDCLIAVSDTIQEELLRLGIGRPTQWRVVPLGLELAELADLPTPIPQQPVRVGMVGRLVPIKNPGMFLEALERSRRAAPGIAITGRMVGDGPLRGALERQASALGLEGCVQFSGWQEDLRRVYQDLEAACLTSWNEGTPVALIEAMAAGRAVIATEVGGVRDLLADGPSSHDAIAQGGFRIAARGLLVRPGDPEGLAAGLCTLARDAQLRQRLGEAARAHVLARYTRERLIADLQTLYEALISRRGGCTR